MCLVKSTSQKPFEENKVINSFTGESLHVYFESELFRCMNEFSVREITVCV